MTTLPEWAKWLVRDEDGDLYAFAEKPYKEKWWWTSTKWIDYLCVEETDDTFAHVKWEDEEPTQIKRGLEAGGVSVEELNRIINAKAHGYDEVPTITDKTEPVYIDKDGAEITVGETTSISFEDAMALVENKMENIQYDWLAENRMVNEVDDIADKRYEKHRNLVDELHNIYVAKNKDYGNSFGESIDEFGIIAGVVRIGDKYNRLKTLAKGHEPLVNDESMVDTLKDMANYCLLTIIELEGK